MSNQPKTPAALMAECFRKVGMKAQQNDFVVYVAREPAVKGGKKYSERFDPDDLNAIARLIAAMSGEQRAIYNRELSVTIWPPNGLPPAISTIWPSETMLAPTATHLAAIAAALGVSIND